MAGPAPFDDTEALFATMAHLFVAEGDLFAVEVLSSAKHHFEWADHDNWNGGFDTYNLYLELPFNLYQKLGENKKALEQKVLDKVQSVSQGHTNDHIQYVAFILEVTAGDNWRQKARKWASGDLQRATSQDELSSDQPPLLEPQLFNIPGTPIKDDQIAVMMPFRAEFAQTYDAIKVAGQAVGLIAVRADDIWKNSTFMQDVFELIYFSRIVIVDFSGRNPNVMYETGIAHTLGRHVIPITRSIDDVPSDLQHYRVLEYLPNEEGSNSLTHGLTI